MVLQQGNDRLDFAYVACPIFVCACECVEELMHPWCVIFWQQFTKASSSSRLTGPVGVDKAAKADTKSFDCAGNSPGLYDFSKISDPLNRLHGSFVPEDVPDAASEKDLVNFFFSFPSVSVSGWRVWDWYVEISYIDFSGAVLRDADHLISLYLTG